MNKDEIKNNGFSGYVRGQRFQSEWLDGSHMIGYGIYHVHDGDISPFGDFSPTGNIEDCQDAGDLIESCNEKEFELI